MNDAEIESQFVTPHHPKSEEEALRLSQAFESVFVTA